MSDQHRVAGHLGVVADEYDQAIRTFIPHYERMLATSGLAVYGAFRD